MIFVTLPRVKSTQHPLYSLRTHSRASFSASAIWAGVILLATTSRNLLPSDFPLEAAIFPDTVPSSHRAQGRNNPVWGNSLLRLDSFKIWLTCSRELGIHNVMAWVLLCMAGGRQRKIRVAPNDSGYSVIKTKQNSIRTAGRRAASQARSHPPIPPPGE